MISNLLNQQFQLFIPMGDAVFMPNNTEFDNYFIFIRFLILIDIISCE